MLIDIGSTQLTMPPKRKASFSEDFRSQCEASKDFIMDKGCFTLASLPEHLRALQMKHIEQKREIESLTNTVALLETQSIVNRTYITSLEDDVTALTESLEAYKITRHQFISTFKKNKSKNPSKEDLDTIAKGDVASAVGDFLVDVELYKGEKARRDWYDFELLYGFPPPVAEGISK